MEGVGGTGFRTVIFDVEGSVGILTINRPRQLNALNRQVLEEISAAIDRAAADSAIRVIVITGQGQKAFVAGADIEEMEALDPAAALDFCRSGQSAFHRIEKCPKPVIAAVNGYALGGGCELAMACDIRIAAKNARFGQPEVALGVIPGFGGTQRLARLVGKAVAMELILSGRMVEAEEALRLGLANRVVPEGDAVKEAMLLSTEIIGKSPFAIGQAKKAVLGGAGLNLDDGLRLEERLFGECFAHPDRKEGMRAFLEKRKPEF